MAISLKDTPNGETQKIHAPNCSEAHLSNREFYHTGIYTETSAFSIRVSDTYRISTKKLVLTLLNFGPNKGGTSERTILLVS